MGLWNRIRDFWLRDKGDATVFSLFLILTGAMVGSFAVDTSNVMSERTRLQIATDSSAQAALVTREFHSETDSIQAAVDRSQVNLPPSVFGHPLDPRNVVFGTWDETSRVFTAQPGSKTAVQVTMFRDKAYNNSVSTFLMGLSGIDNLSLATRAVFEVYFPQCLNQGFVSTGVVDLQSNNSYFKGFCIHSQQYVSVNSGNYWEQGTVVSMPDISNLQLPASGFSTNIGLKQALQNQSFNIRILKQIPLIIAGLTDPTSEYFQPYITNPTPITLSHLHKIDNTVVSPGNIYVWDCSDNSQISAGTILQNVVIIANCKVNLGNGVQVENSVLANTSTASDSFSAPSSFQLGANDSCAAGGGAQIVTLGGFSDASSLAIYGSQIVAQGPISFAALANGIQGASLISGTSISGTSLMNMSVCPPSGMNEFRAEYFRLVQ